MYPRALTEEPSIRILGSCISLATTIVVSPSASTTTTVESSSEVNVYLPAQKGLRLWIRGAPRPRTIMVALSPSTVTIRSSSAPVSFSSVMVISFLPSTSMVWLAKPINETVSDALGSPTSRENDPSLAVAVPLFVPVSTTPAPARG